MAQAQLAEVSNRWLYCFPSSTRPLCLNCSLPAAHRSLACAGKETPAAKRRSDCRPASSNSLSPVGFCLMTFPPTPSSHPPTSPSHPPSSLAGKDCQPSQHKRSFAHEAIPTEPDLQMPLHKSPPPTHASQAMTGGDKPAAASINNRLSHISPSAKSEASRTRSHDSIAHPPAEPSGHPRTQTMPTRTRNACLHLPPVSVLVRSHTGSQRHANRHIKTLLGCLL